MNQTFRRASRDELLRALTPRQWRVLRLLSEAWFSAVEEGQNVWQFAVDIDRLFALGLRQADLRRLLCGKYIQHAQERTTEKARRRTFRPLKALILPKRTCFVLTAKGQEAISASLGEAPGGS